MQIFESGKRWKFCLHALRWTAMLAVLALGGAMALRSPAAYAQDGGTQPGQPTEASYEVVVLSDDNLDRICVGRRFSYPVSVQRVLAADAAADAGHARILAVKMDVSSSNADVITANLVPSANTPFQPRLDLQAVTIGRSTVTIGAIIGAEEKVVTSSVSLQFRVIPCTIKLQLSGGWSTRVGMAAAAVIVAIPDARMAFPTNMLPIHTMVTMTWDTTANRIRGCEGAAHQHIPDRVETVVHLQEDSLLVNMEFYQQSATTIFMCMRPFVTGIDCDRLPDKDCYPDLKTTDMWQIQRISVELPLEGGSKPIDLTVMHDGGTATTKATITLTPVTNTSP